MAEHYRSETIVDGSKSKKQGWPVTVQVAQNVPTTVLKNTKKTFPNCCRFFLHVVIKNLNEKIELRHI